MSKDVQKSGTPVTPMNDHIRVEDIDGPDVDVVFDEIRKQSTADRGLSPN